MSEITAAFGGRFDPPHLGHREAIRGLFGTPGVREVRVLVAPAPPHKPAIAAAEHRLEMARLAFSPAPGAPFPSEVQVDDRELQRSRLRPGEPTYSFDTLMEMKREYGEGRLAFVIGSDQLEKFPEWHRFPEILGLCHWIFLARKPNGEACARKTLTEWEANGLATRTGDSTWRLLRGNTVARLAPTDAPAISSTEIREAIALQGKIPENRLPVPVSVYLKKHSLYGSTP